MPYPQLDLPTGAALQDGKYRIVRKLGQGGFGITYLAMHRAFGEVAVKELFISSGNTQCSRDTKSGRTVIPHFEGDTFLHFKDRFLSEAKTLYNLRDIRGVVKIIDIFEENDTVYFSMDYLNGTKLDDYVRQRYPLSEKESAKLVTDIAEALKKVHDKKVLHRDLKPSNIIVAGNGEITLIDFGIARDYAGDSDSHTHTTFYSPVFSPPEQKIARSRMGTYSDVYSLGAVSYFIYTGKFPQNIEERTADGYTSPDQLNKEIPGHITAAINQSLALKVEDRLSTVQDFLNIFKNNGAVNQETTTLIDPVSVVPPAAWPKAVDTDTVIEKDVETRVDQTQVFDRPYNDNRNDNTIIDTSKPAPPDLSVFDQLIQLLKRVKLVIWIILALLTLVMLLILFYPATPKVTPPAPPPQTEDPQPEPNPQETPAMPDFKVSADPANGSVKVGEQFSTTIALNPKPNPSFEVKIRVNGQSMSVASDGRCQFQIKATQSGTYPCKIVAQVTNPGTGEVREASGEFKYSVISPPPQIVKVEYKFTDIADDAAWAEVLTFGSGAREKKIKFDEVSGSNRPYARKIQQLLETGERPQSIEFSPEQMAGKKIKGTFKFHNLPDKARFSSKIAFAFKAESNSDVMVSGRIYSANRNIREARFNFRKRPNNKYGNISEDLSRFKDQTVYIEIIVTAQNFETTNRVFLVDAKITGTKRNN